jgi:hypothetical protein
MDLQQHRVDGGGRGVAGGGDGFIEDIRGSDDVDD